MKSRNRWKQELRDFILAPIYRLLIFLFGRLSWRRAQKLGALVGALSWKISTLQRVRSLEHLKIAFPAATPERRRAIGRASFVHQGMNLGENLHLLEQKPEAALERLEVRGWEHLEKAHQSDRPTLIITGHCGNWELLSPAINLRGIPLNTMARKLDDPMLDSLAQRLRTHYGTTVIGRGTSGAARQLLKVLRNSQTLTMLIDQDTRVEGVWVPFFGKAAYTPVGAAKIALRQQATVIPIFSRRLENRTHEVIIHPPLDLPDFAEEATALMTQTIEQHIRANPEQWVWLHRRWKRRPPEETAELNE